MAPVEITTTNEDNQFTGSRPTPTIPDGGSFSVYNKVTIRATPQAVLTALTTFSTWKHWCRLVPDVTIDKLAKGQTDANVWAEDQVVTFNCRMTVGSDSVTKNKEMCVQAGPLVTKASVGEGQLARTTVRWCSRGLPQFVIKAEHVNWIDDNGDGTVTYQHWETFTGYAVAIVKAQYGQALHDHFIAWGEDLKAYLERSGSQ